MSELTTKTIAELREGLAVGSFSAREVATAYNAAVEAGRRLKVGLVSNAFDPPVDVKFSVVAWLCLSRRFPAAVTLPTPGVVSSSR